MLEQAGKQPALTPEIKVINENNFSLVPLVNLCSNILEQDGKQLVITYKLKRFLIGLSGCKMFKSLENQVGSLKSHNYQKNNNNEEFSKVIA